jgi:hypothetical protein
MPSERAEHRSEVPRICWSGVINNRSSPTNPGPVSRPLSSLYLVGRGIAIRPWSVQGPAKISVVLPFIARNSPVREKVLASTVKLYGDFSRIRVSARSQCVRLGR